ncbi:MAG: SDR family NAD-dependent epimerase/dehydratase, partial [Planctomycetota bacterium]
GPVNIGNQSEFTIRELAELVIELTGSKSKLVERPLPADDPTRRRPDISLAIKQLGWEPTTPLSEGLARTIDWFRSIQLDEYRAPTPNY